MQERDKKGRFIKGFSGSPIQKGHKINVGKICSEETKRKISEGNKKEKIIKICLACKKEFSVWPSLKNRKFCSKKCSIKSQKGKPAWNKGLKGFRAGEKHDWMPSGKFHWSWRGGKSRDKHSLREPKYKEWRSAVLERDGWKCRIGNEDCVDILEVHHILRWSSHPELRYNLNNGITLCRAHHPRKRAEEKRLIPILRGLVSVSKAQQF